MLGLPSTREIAGRIARALEGPPARRPPLRSADGRAVALEHLRTACRALADGGLTHAEVFRELRLLVNRLEAGGLPAPELSARAASRRSAPPLPRARPSLRRLLAALPV